MSQQPQSPPAGQQPPAQSSPGGEGVVEVVAVAVIIALALPAIVVAAIISVIVRQASRRARAIVASAGAVAAAIEALAWPGYKAALAKYAGALTAVVDAIEHHAHRPVASALAGTLWLAVPVGLIAGAGYRLYTQHTGVRKAQQQPQSGAPTATPKQLASLIIPGPQRDRVVLGRLGSKLVASPVERHVAIIAPTRSGKTRGLLAPSILDWQGPVIATSAKSDLLYDTTFESGTYAYRTTLGPVWVFDPSGSSGWPCVQWSPLGRAETFQGALRAAHTMVSAERPVGAGEDSGTSRFFAARAAAVLAPCLYAVALAGGGMRDVLTLVRSAKDLGDLADSLAVGLDGAEPEALSATEALRVGSESSSGDVLATVANLLAQFDDPKVAHATDSCEFDTKELLLNKGTLYIVAGTDNQRLAPLFASLLNDIFLAVREKALRDGPLNPRLLCSLDEVSNIAPVPGLPQLLSTVAGLGVTIITAWQSVSQMARWGPKASSEILGNSACQLWTATDDPETSEHLSRVLGKVLVPTTSVTSDPQRGWFAPASAQQRSISTSWTERSVIDPSATRLLSGGPLLVAQGLPPTAVQWRFHDRDKALRAKSSMPLPEIERPEPDEPEPEPAEDFGDDFMAAYRGRV